MAPKALFFMDDVTIKFGLQCLAASVSHESLPNPKPKLVVIIREKGFHLLDIRKLTVTEVPINNYTIDRI